MSGGISTKKVRVQNIKNHLDTLRNRVRQRCHVPKDLANETDFFHHQEIVNQQILNVLDKIVEDLDGD